jgi:hypothetical protein
MTSAFLSESCQGDRTQGQQSILKSAKSTVELHSVWHGIYVATETGGQMRAVVLLRAPAQERPRKSEGSTPRCTNITTIIFPPISKTVMRTHAEESEATAPVSPAEPLCVKFTSRLRNLENCFIGLKIQRI